MNSNLKAYAGNGKYIFISYSHKDKEEVYPIIEHLQKNGYNVWFDEGITPGEEWPEFIAEQVIDCTCFIGFISENSANSKECKNEIYLADNENKDIFTILLEETTLSPGLKMKLSTAQSIMKYNYKEEGNFYIKLFETEKLQECKNEEEFQIMNNKLIRYHGKLENIIIPEIINRVGYNAFENCSSIKTVEITKNIRQIGKYAFYGCNNLVQFIVDEDNDSFSDKDGILYNKSGSCLMCYPAKKINNEYSIPEKTKRVQAFAFKNCSNLVNITIPNTVTKIDEQAFESCTSLITIEIPQTIDQIEQMLFRNCASLVSIKLPENLKTIASNAFSGCMSLQKIELPESLESIERMAFSYCDSLKRIKFPSKITKIADYTFYECSELEEIDFGNVVEIDDYAFKYCEEIKHLIFTDKIKKIGFASFSRNNKIEDIYISKSIRKIGGYAFDCNPSLKKVIIEEGLEKIEEGTFYACENLEEIYLPKSIKKIESKAFYKCKLTNINYAGNKEDWNKIEIENENDEIKIENVRFECKISKDT